MTPKSAEALRVEAESALMDFVNFVMPRPSVPGALRVVLMAAPEIEKVRRAIDLAIAARAAEVAEEVFDSVIAYRDLLGLNRKDDDDSVAGAVIEQILLRCTEARARLRAEMDRLTHAD